MLKIADTGSPLNTVLLDTDSIVTKIQYQYRILTHGSRNYLKALIKQKGKIKHMV